MRYEDGMMAHHMTIEQLPYGKPVQDWLKDRYGETEANQIWKQTQANYRDYLQVLPDYGGSKNGHAKAIYGGLLIFALYPALPDQPPVSELQDFVQNLFMGPFTKLGRVFNLNRPYSEGFVNIDAPYDKEHHAASYSFTQCPNAEFAKKHGLLHVLPLLCNSDFFGISELHGTLIRCGTCGNSDVCDYLIVGSDNPIAKEYETSADEQGFLVSRKRQSKNARVES